MKISVPKINVHGFLYYTTLNYIDKGLNFFCPFLFLKFQPGTVYADIEYLISISLLISSFSDIGLRQYLFYAYRNSNNRSEFCDEAHQESFILLSGYVILFLVMTALFSFSSVLMYGLLRGIFLTYINIESCICRLKDNPSKIFYYSILTNTSIITILLICIQIERTMLVWMYASIYIAFSCGVFIKAIEVWRKSGINCVLRTFILLKKSLYYSFPLILVLIMAGIQNNIIKLYGYNKLSINEFESLAVLLRCFTFLLLAHTSIVNYFAKHIYTAIGGINRKELISYFIFIFSVYACMLILLLLSNNYSIIGRKIIFDNRFIILSITYLCMMTRAYIEQYFGKFAKLKYALLSMSISFGVCTTLFSLWIGLSGNSIVLLLLILMFSELLNLTITISIYKNKISPLCITE
jgi:hypothetical protein